MRPAGVEDRMRELGSAEFSIVSSWADRGLRVSLTSFVDLCARLWFDDHSVGTVLRGFDDVEALLDDRDQLRTGSDFETRCLSAVAELRPMVTGLSSRSLDEQDSVVDVLVQVPAWAILGEYEDESHFDLVCWNEANSVVELVQRPYRAARHIASESFHEPADRFGLVPSMTELAVRYEDVPEARDETAAEIVRVLDEFRARAPWPVTE